MWENERKTISREERKAKERERARVRGIVVGWKCGVEYEREKLK